MFLRIVNVKQTNPVSIAAKNNATIIDSEGTIP